MSCPCPSNIGQPDTFLDRLAVAAEQAQAGDGDAGKLQPFWIVHAQESHRHPPNRNPVAIVPGHIDRHVMPGEDLRDPPADPVLRVETRGA